MLGIKIDRTLLLIILTVIMLIGVFLPIFVPIPLNIFIPYWVLFSISIIASIIALGIAFYAGIKYQSLPVEEKTTNVKFGFAIWILVLLAIVSVAFIPYYPYPQKTDITITEPKNNTIVSRENDTYIKGTRQNLPTGSTIWIALFHKNTYYPLAHAPEIGPNDWSISYTFNHEKSGETFEIVALLVDAQAQKEIQAYLNKSTVEGYPGLRHISGSTRYGGVEVTQG